MLGPRPDVQGALILNISIGDFVVADHVLRAIDVFQEQAWSVP